MVRLLRCGSTTKRGFKKMGLLSVFVLFLS